MDHQSDNSVTLLLAQLFFLCALSPPCHHVFPAMQNAGLGDSGGPLTDSF